jgi:hypothetical protein
MWAHTIVFEIFWNLEIQIFGCGSMISYEVWDHVIFSPPTMTLSWASLRPCFFLRPVWLLTVSWSYLPPWTLRSWSSRWKQMTSTKGYQQITMCHVSTVKSMVTFQIFWTENAINLEKSYLMIYLSIFNKLYIHGILRSCRTQG